MNDTQIENKIDNWIGPGKMAMIQQKEDEFLAANGKYFQGIVTPVVYPVDGADADPDLTLHPTDQAQDWAAFFGSAASSLGKFPCSISIEYHKGPLGEGFTITFRYTNAQGIKRWRKVGIGPYGVTAPWQPMGLGPQGK
jgi:hypothetical protein